MNKLILFLVFLILISTGAYLYLNQSVDTQSENQNKSVTELNEEEKISDKQTTNITFQPNSSSSEYVIKSLTIRNPGDIQLFSNMVNKQSSSMAMTEHDCTDLVTAGFYTKEYQHIGLFISNFNRLSEANSTLSNSAYFSIDSKDKPEISLLPPTDARLAVQTYPLIIQNNEIVRINNNSDDHARRIVVATTSEDQVVFMVLYSQDSVYKGPTLSELSELIKKYDEKEKSDFVNVLNLDGGTHSAIISKYINLPELSTIGGYFCMKY